MGEQVALLALLLLQHARRDARSNAVGDLVALEDQDRTTWDAGNIAEGLSLLQKVQRIDHAGVYRIQAAIAGIHARAMSDQDTDWAGIQAHYAALYVLQPTPVIRLNHIAAQAKTEGAAFALREMQALETDLHGYRWFHAMRGGLLLQTGDYDAAITAYDTALSLDPTGPERHAIQQKISLCREMSVVM